MVSIFSKITILPRSFKDYNVHMVNTDKQEQWSPQKFHNDISISFMLIRNTRYAQYMVNLLLKFLITFTLKIVLSYFQSQCTQILRPCALMTRNNKSMCSHDL